MLRKGYCLLLFVFVSSSLFYSVALAQMTPQVEGRCTLLGGQGRRCVFDSKSDFYEPGNRICLSNVDCERLALRCQKDRTGAMQCVEAKYSLREDNCSSTADCYTCADGVCAVNSQPKPNNGGTCKATGELCGSYCDTHTLRCADVSGLLEKYRGDPCSADLENGDACPGYVIKCVPSSNQKGKSFCKGFARTNEEPGYVDPKCSNVGALPALCGSGVKATAIPTLAPTAPPTNSPAGF